MYRIYSVHNWLFIIHRLTGTALVVYFVAHVLAVSTALVSGPVAFTDVMAAFRQPAFRIVEWLILGCAAFHGLNGLRIVASERGWLNTGASAVVARTAVGATIGLWIAGAVLAVAR